MKLEEHVVQSSSGEYSRKVWWSKGAKDKAQKLGLFLDADAQPELGLQRDSESAQILIVVYKALLLFGAPGSGKGTQGKILGTIPGFYHCACGDVFRAVDVRSDFGKAFLHYSSKGQLVPDDVSIGLWSAQIDKMVQSNRFKPDIDFLVLDGIPRNCNQAKILGSKLDVRRIFHLTCSDKTKIYDRLKRRALKDNRLDDINEEVIERRLKVYEEETKPVLEFYGPKIITHVNADQWPYQVLRDILNDIEHFQKTPVD